MIFVKIDVLLPRHPRMLAIDRASTLGVYVGCLCYTREHQLDGFVPETAFRSFPSHGAKDVSDLVRVGLLEVCVKDGVSGFTIPRYAEKNETKAEIDERRKYEREKKQKQRACPVGTTVGTPQGSPPGCPDSDSGISNFVLLEGGAGGNQPAKIPDAPATGVRPSEQAYQRAYETGIREGFGNGAGYAMPENQRGALHQGIQAHSEGRRGDRLLAWIQAAASDFADDMRRRPDEQKYYSAMGPRGWLRWLNEEAAKEHAKAIP